MAAPDVACISSLKQFFFRETIDGPSLDFIPALAKCKSDSLQLCCIKPSQVGSVKMLLGYQHYIPIKYKKCACV
jgi:hypothetical protein